MDVTHQRNRARSCRKEGEPCRTATELYRLSAVLETRERSGSGGNKRDNTVAGNRKDLRYWQIKFRRCRAHSFQPLPWAQKDLRGRCRYFALVWRSLLTSARRSGSQTLEVAETRQGGDLRTTLPNRGAQLPAEFRFWVAQTKRNRHTASLGTLSRNTASG